MTEKILKVLVKNRGVDKDGNWLINAEYDDLQTLAKKIEKAITVTRCCKSDSELLKDEQKLSFEDWCITYGYDKSVTGNFVKEGVRYTADEMQFKYDYNMT